MAPDIRTILQLSVPVIVQIGQRKMSMDDVLALQPGAILELDKHADDDLSVLINNKPVGSGSAVKVGENFGLRISQIGSTRQRIAALAGDESEAGAQSGENTRNAEHQAPAEAEAQ